MNPTLAISATEFGSISVTFDRWDGDRAQYTWRVEVLDQVYEGDDLRMGSGQMASCAEALHSLLDFLGAFAEAVRHSMGNYDYESENLDLFPEEMRDWAYGVGSDQFAILGDDLRSVS